MEVELRETFQGCEEGDLHGGGRRSLISLSRTVHHLFLVPVWIFSSFFCRERADSFVSLTFHIPTVVLFS